MRSCFICVILFFSVSNQLFAQAPTNLVLEGAGIRGVAYAGAIRFLEEKEMLKGIERVGGTSAGAIAALAISLGYSSKEIEDLIYKTKLQKFNDGRFFFIGGFTRLNRNYGWYRGKAFTRWLEDVIEKKTGDPEITFEELTSKGFKDLYVTGTSLNNQKLIVFSAQSYPKMKIKDAIRISMSIPLYFEAVLIDSTGRIINQKKIKGSYDLMVDGGFTGNFPITIFDTLHLDNHGMKRVVNRETIGLRIDAPEQIKYDSLQLGLAPIPIQRFKNYMSAFYIYVIENLNREKLTSEDWSRTVSISSGMIGPKIRKLSIAEKDLLVRNGYEGMRRFFLTTTTE
jgi:NTE family protein